MLREGQPLVRILASSVLLFSAVSPALHADPVVLDGAPRTGWASGHYCQQIDALHAALGALGCPWSYEELLVASGGAFKTVWCPGRYSFFAADHGPEDLVLNGAEAAGAVAQRYTHASDEEAWGTVKAALDAGQPVLTWRGTGARAILGYDEAKSVVFKRDYHTTGPDYDEIPFEAQDAPPPLKATHEVVIIDYAGDGDPPELDWPVILERAVTYADWPAERPVHRYYLCGLAAYDGLAQTIRQGPDQNGPRTDCDLLLFALSALVDARNAAASILQENADVHEAFSDAGISFDDEAGLLAQSLRIFTANAPGGQDEILGAMEANFARDDMRERAASLIEQARDKHVLAIDSLREALTDFRAQPTEPETVAPAADPQGGARAEAHVARGRQLKAQHKYTEAEAALGEALALDPEHTEAHWVLGWVLLELQRTDDAIAEFEAVIRTDPDSAPAAEARKAIDRLKQ